MRKILFIVLVQAMVAAGAPAAAENPALAPRGALLRRFSASNMAPRAVTRAEAVEIAARFDVISALPSQFRDHVDAMKAANPDLVLLLYLNGTFAQRSEASAFPDAWYLRDSAGRKVTSSGFGNYLMNPTVAGWLDGRATECASGLAATRYDGCFVDMLGAAPLDPGYLSAFPVNPSTGRVWAPRDWMKATAGVAARIQSRVGSRPVVGNGLGSGTRYFDPDAPTEILLDATDAALAEAWLRAPGAPIGDFKSETAWKRDVDLLVDAGARADHAFVMTKVWTGGTVEQKDAWHRYALASFLLGTDGRAFFSFLRENAPTEGHPWDEIDVGRPLGPYARSGGVYRRGFTKGLALVNPTGSAVTVALDGTYTTLDGAAATSVTLPPNGGEVLLAGRFDPVLRVGGADRIDTAVRISQQGFANQAAPAGVLATAGDFADGLAGTPLSRAKRAPLLLTGGQRLDPRAEAEVVRAVRPGATVFVLGGQAALSEAVVARLAALGYAPVRLGGADRYETAVAIARQGLGDPATIVFTTGTDFADALCGGVGAAATGAALLLTDGARLPRATAAYLAAREGVRRIAIGGPAAAAVSGAERIVGADRYDTCRLVAAQWFRQPPAVGVASGEAFPDGLSGGSDAARRGVPLLLTATRELPDAVRRHLEAAAASVATAIVYGGPAAVDDRVRFEVMDAIT